MWLKAGSVCALIRNYALNNCVCLAASIYGSCTSTIKLYFSCLVVEASTLLPLGSFIAYIKLYCFLWVPRNK